MWFVHIEFQYEDVNLSDEIGLLIIDNLGSLVAQWLKERSIKFDDLDISDYHFEISLVFRHLFEKDTSWK